MHKVNQDTYAKLFASLLDAPQTCYQLAEETGLHLKTVQDLMRTLHRHKVVHIKGWEPNGRDIDTTPVFAFGKGRDVRRRKRSRAEISAAYRERKKNRLMVVALAGVIE